MEIRGVGGVNPADKFQHKKNIQASSIIKNTAKDDSLKVSDQARFLEDEAFIREVLAKTPDIDQNRIDAVKKRMESGDYNKKETLDALTEKLIKVLGF